MFPVKCQNVAFILGVWVIYYKHVFCTYKCGQIRLKKHIDVRSQQPHDCSPAAHHLEIMHPPCSSQMMRVVCSKNRQGKYLLIVVTIPYQEPFIKVKPFSIVPICSRVNNLTGEAAVSLISCIYLTENKSQ